MNDLPSNLVPHTAQEIANDLRTIGQGGEGYELSPAQFQTIERAAAALEALSLPDETSADEGFQARVHDWMAQCFVRPDAMLPAQRSFRFTEEALELAQASGTSRENVMRLVDYVYGRPVGTVDQEIGGVVVTLVGLANSVGLSVEYAGNAELARCVENTAKIRAKDLAKPQRSPLPGSPEEPSPRQLTESKRVSFERALRNSTRVVHEGELVPEKATETLPTCQHDLLQPNTTIAVDPADPFHAWCTVCKHDFRTRAPLKDSIERCGNWPCQLPIYHVGPCCSSGAENGSEKQIMVCELLAATRAELPDPDFIPDEEREVRVRQLRERIDAYLSVTDYMKARSRNDQSKI